MTYADGLTVRGRFRDWHWIYRHMVCRQCGATITGRPFSDPWDGGYDHGLFVCNGDHEHVIQQEGDLEPREQREWVEENQQWQKIDVLDAYGLTPKPTTALYVEPDFEGFGDLPPKETDDADQAAAR